MATVNPIRIRLRYADLDTFIEKFAPNVTRGGIFLASRNIYAVGTVVPFEIQLMKGEVVLAGQGRVTWVKEFNPAEPNRPYGMGVQFLGVEPATKPILARLLRAKEAGIKRRSTTGPMPTLDGASAGHPHVAGKAGTANGKPIAAPVDTSVDLAAEYGLEEYAIRHVIERTWMTGARTSDDLADLLKPEPIESVTLAQALSELPRLLDPQYSRRRAAGGLRGMDAAREARGLAANIGPTAPDATPIAEPAGAVEPGPAEMARSVDRPYGSGAETTQQSPSVIGLDTGGATHLGGGGDDRHDRSEAAAASAHTAELGDATDMTGARDTAESTEAVSAEPIAASGGNGRAGRKRRR